MKTSRRTALRTLGFIALGAALTGRAAAQAKASKQAMKYQEQPNNGQQCATCMQFIPGATPDASGTCKVVEGPISPKGWCIAYVKKG